MHMPTSDQPDPVTGTGGGLAVEYTATGSEGTSFMVPIGTTVNTTTYTIIWSPAGLTNVPMLDLPQGVGDRTVTQFRVLTAVQLAAGETLAFVLFGA
jgi:hypothetical protein